MSPTSEHEHQPSPSLELLARLGDTFTTRAEPSYWLRLRAQAAALALAAEGPIRRGARLIVPLVPERGDDRCARCDRPPTHHAGFEATSDALPGVRLSFTFRLCDEHRRKEYGDDR